MSLQDLDAAVADLARVCRAVQGGQALPTAVQSRQFRAVVTAFASTAPRYAAAQADERSVIREIDPHNHLNAFLQRTDFVRRAQRDDFASRAYAESLLAEAERQRCRVTALIPLDGLELQSDELPFSAGRFVRITEHVLRAFLDGETVEGEGAIDKFVDVWGVEVTVERPNPPWGPTLFEWDSAAKQVQALAQPYLSTVDLWDQYKVNPSGMYQKSDSLFVVPHVRAVGIEEPVRDYISFDHEDGEGGVDEVPFYRVRVDDEPQFIRFVDALASRIGEARHRTHRVDTAVRFFQRVSGQYWQHHVLGYGDDVEANEDLVIDAVTGLEAIFLTGEQRGKGQRIAERAGALIESDIQTRRKLRRDLEDLYELRSAILHGDEQRTSEALRAGAVLGEDVLRRSLTAFIMLRGDLQAVVNGVRDQAIAEANRQEASRI